MYTNVSWEFIYIVKCRDFMWQCLCGSVLVLSIILLAWIPALLVGFESRAGEAEVVMAMAYGYSVHQVEAFVLSLRQHFQNDVILFVRSDASKELLDFCQSLNVKAVKVPEKLKEQPHEYRMQMYREFCVAPYKKCFFADVRDVFFQGNPFEGIDERDDLTFWEEWSGMTVGSNSFNRDWIFKCFGEEGVRRLKDYHVICSGTIHASPRGANVLFLLMRQIAAKRCCEICDQGHLNWIVRTRMLDSLKVSVIPNGKGGVLTVGAIPEAQLSVGPIRLNQGHPSVIHQYDRHSRLAEYVAKTVRAKLPK